MDRMVKLPRVGGLIYHGVKFTTQGDQFSIRAINIPWMQIEPGFNIPWGSKYHMTPVGSFTHPSACVVFCTSGPQLGVKCKDQDYQRRIL